MADMVMRAPKTASCGKTQVELHPSAHLTCSRRWRRVGGSSGCRHDHSLGTLDGTRMRPHAGKTLKAMNGTQQTVKGWLTSVPFFRLLPLRSAAHCGAVLQSTGMVRNRALTFALLRLHLQSLWKRGTHEWFGMIHAVSSASTWTRVPTPFAVAAQRTRSKPIFTVSGPAQQTGRSTELRRFNICWPKPAAFGSHARYSGSEVASHEPGLNPRMSQNLCRLMNPRYMLLSVSMEQEMAREGSIQRIHGIADVDMGLSWSALGRA